MFLKQFRLLMLEVINSTVCVFVCIYALTVFLNLSMSCQSTAVYLNLRHNVFIVCDV